MKLEIPAIESERISAKVSFRFLKRLQRHLLFGKKSRSRNISQQEWIREAIEEKLSRSLDTQNTQNDTLKNLTVRVDKNLKDAIEQQVKTFKDSGSRSRSYSKKNWILDAIEEKIEQEENS